MNNLFEYLCLLNEARSVDKNDAELYKRQQKVCDEIEKVLGIQKFTPEFGEGEIVCNNYTINNYSKLDSSKVAEEINKNITCDHRGLV